MFLIFFILKCSKSWYEKKTYLQLQYYLLYNAKKFTDAEPG